MNSELKLRQYAMRLLYAVALLLCCSSVMAQGIHHDVTLDYDFEAQVKSIDEFMARFNGKESKPGLSKGKLNRRDNIISLFDSSIAKASSKEAFKAAVLEFCNAVTTWQGKLKLLDAGAYAETYCTIKYKGKKIKVVFIMQQESIDKTRCRWGIVAARGLKDAGFYNNKRATLSPVDHELHFMSLDDYFKSNKDITPALRSKKKEIDDLSMLMGLIYSSTAQFVSVDNVKFHFMDVPGYVFVVEEKARRGTNSGWLITKCVKSDKKAKNNYINKLYGKQQ